MEHKIRFAVRQCLRNYAQGSRIRAGIGTLTKYWRENSLIVSQDKKKKKVTSMRTLKPCQKLRDQQDKKNMDEIRKGLHPPPPLGIRAIIVYKGLVSKSGKSSGDIGLNRVFFKNNN